MSVRRRVAILGSTGSIGRQALDIIRWMPDRFEVVALAAGTSSDLLWAQVEEFRPRLVGIGRPDGAGAWRGVEGIGRAETVGGGRGVGGALLGEEGLCSIAADPAVDLLVVATVGRAGLCPTYEAVSLGKTVALANKEALVMAGRLMTETARRTGAKLLPVDSEHSAIWQCLAGEGGPEEWPSRVRSLILTASGGALRDLPLDSLESVRPAQVLDHPTWKMGPKITIDSATLMNKGLEVIEALWLFGLPLDSVKVLLHRESLVHSLVEFVDGSVKAQLGPADMRIPIQYAMCYPDRVEGMSERLDLARVGTLSFGEIDLARYPCLRLALQAARMEASYPTALSAANEVAVDLFMRGRISFGMIPRLVEGVLERHRPVAADNMEAILHVDGWARDESLRLARSL